jgi:hypothetical protein
MATFRSGVAEVDAHGDVVDGIMRRVESGTDEHADWMRGWTPDGSSW